MKVTFFFYIYFIRSIKLKDVSSSFFFFSFTCHALTLYSLFSPAQDASRFREDVTSDAGCRLKVLLCHTRAVRHKKTHTRVLVVNSLRGTEDTDHQTHKCLHRVVIYIRRNVAVSWKVRPLVDDIISRVSMQLHCIYCIIFNYCA